MQDSQQGRAYQGVVEQLQEAIIEGEFQAGDRLPPERELSEKFSTSRGTIREALRILEHKGLVSIRIGGRGGAVVKAANSDSLNDSLELLIRSSEVSLENLAEFREGVESIVACLAVERASQKDIERLKGLELRAIELTEKGLDGWEELLKVDTQVHQALAQIAGNPIYIALIQSIYQNIHRYFYKHLPATMRNMRDNMRDICEIVRAVENRQAFKAGVLLQSHVYRFNRAMENSQAEEDFDKSSRPGGTEKP
jgi:DNA-binding FadR family transcriptional regulator